MKKGLFILSFAFMAVFASAQCDPVTEINENFNSWEEIDPCWTAVSNGGMVYADSNITFYSFMSANISMYFISPEIVEGEYILSFDAGTIPLGEEQTEGVTLEVGTLATNGDTSSFIAVNEPVTLLNDFQTVEVPVTFTADAKYFAVKVSTLAPHSAAGIDNLVLSPSLAGVNDLNNATVQVYPNPVVNQMQISADANIQEVKIYSLTGQLVQNQKLNGKSANLNVSALKAGVYVAQIITEKGVQTVKVLKK